MIAWETPYKFVTVEEAHAGKLWETKRLFAVLLTKKGVIRWRCRVERPAIRSGLNRFSSGGVGMKITKKGFQLILYDAPV